jgi:hypothetical protein
MYDRVLITGKKEFDVAAEIQSLPFSVVIYSKYACRACVQKLKKRRAILTTLYDIEGFFRNSACKRSADLATIEDQEPTATVSKRICDEARGAGATVAAAATSPVAQTLRGQHGGNRLPFFPELHLEICALFKEIGV